MFLVIDDIGEDVFGACLQYFHWFFSVRGVSGVVVDLMVFLVLFMCPFSVDMARGGCFMMSTVMLVNVVSFPFLVAWSTVFLIRLKSATCYHLASSGLLLSDRKLSTTICCWIGGWSGLLVRLTCHMHDVFDRLSSNTVSPYLNTLR